MEFCNSIVKQDNKKNVEDRPSMHISKLKISSNIIDFEYLDPSDDESLLHSIEPSLSNLKEQLLIKVPSNAAEVSQYDDLLEELPIRQTYTLIEQHSRVSAEVLAD